MHDVRLRILETSGDDASTTFELAMHCAACRMLQALSRMISISAGDFSVTRESEWRLAVQPLSSALKASSGMS